MRRFKFSLESVLTVRKKALEDERITLAKIIKMLNEQKNTLEEMFLNLKNLELQAQKYQTGEFNPVIMSNIYSYSAIIQRDIENQKKIIEETGKKLNNQQKRTQESYIKVQSLEKLKEKQKQQYDKEIMAQEIKLLDDIVNSKRIRA